MSCNSDGYPRDYRDDYCEAIEEIEEYQEFIDEILGFLGVDLDLYSASHCDSVDYIKKRKKEVMSILKGNDTKVKNFKNPLNTKELDEIVDRLYASGLGDMHVVLLADIADAAKRNNVVIDITDELVEAVEDGRSLDDFIRSTQSKTDSIPAAKHK